MKEVPSDEVAIEDVLEVEETDGKTECAGKVSLSERRELGGISMDVAEDNSIWGICEFTSVVVSSLVALIPRSGETLGDMKGLSGDEVLRISGTGL